MKTGVESWALRSPEGTYHKLREPNFFVGREDDMDLTLKSRSVDKQHAVISVDVENREYQLHDLGTLNGTFVNDVRVKQQPLNLKLRDNIRFGYVEESSTLSDVLRCATGDKYLSRKLKVVVASEKSLRDLSFVKLSLPVVILDKNDKKVVSFLLKPEEIVVTLCPERKRQPSFDEERHQYHGNDSHPLETVWESNRSQPAPERKLSIQSSAHQANSDEDVGHPGTPDQDLLHMYHGVHSPHTPRHSQFHSYPHYPYMTPMYHHPPPVMCHCPSCTGHQSPVHSPHGVHHQMSPHTGWSHAPPTAFQVRPRLQRPLSAPGPENFKMIVKGSPLYGQPPWWGWGSSDDEIYNYPNTATLVEGEAKGVQQALSMRKKKLTKKDALEMTQRRHSIGTVSVLSESKARIVTTRTSNSTYVPEQLMNQRDEFRVHQKNSSLPSPGYSDQLSPVFENSTSRDWEMPNSHGENERGSNLTEYDSSVENSADDSNDGHSRPAYEIPFIPDYDEIPERPVSQKSNKGKQPTRDDLRSSASTGDKQDGTTRKKPISKIKKRTPGSEAVIKDGKTSSVSRKHSSDTSESECEPSSHPSRRSGVVTRGIPSSSRVFGLTEVSLQRVRDGDSRENLTPAALPNWVQQWANTIDNLDNCSGRQPIEVLGSSSSTEDSTFSSGENKPNLVKVDASSGLISRPRAASGRTNSPSVMRSQSLSAASLSSPSKSTSSPRVTRSKTISAAIRRSYPMSTGNDSDSRSTDSTRRRGVVSSTSDDSDVESSNTSQTRQTKDSRRTFDESEKKGVQLIPEKEGKRPLSAPRPNKTAMLRAHNSREAAKNSGVKNKTPTSAKSRNTKTSPPNSTGNGSSTAVNDSSPSARVWTPSARSSTKSSTGDDNLGGNSITYGGDDDVTQEEVDEMFSGGPVHPLPESLQMKRDANVNKTFVLDEGKRKTPVSSPEDSSMQAWVNKDSSSENILESKDRLEKSSSPTPPTTKEPSEVKLESTGTRGISLRSKLIPFAPLLDSPPYTPPVSSLPFEPPCDSADDISGRSRSSTGEGRSISPDSVVSAAPATSPSPPLTPSSAVKKIFDFKGGAVSSPSRRQWGVTDKPVEDLMLSSIHAFSVELRLASESVLSKVRTLYDGSEELNGTTRTRNDSDCKHEAQSAIPDWKSSHAEIAGIFRNLRKVELRLRTMEQALSIMCVAAQRDPNQSFQERKLSMVETSSLGSGQKWREFKIKARRNSWAVEHRNQFPVPPAESDEEDEDTS